MLHAGGQERLTFWGEPKKLGFLVVRIRNEFNAAEGLKPVGYDLDILTRAVAGKSN